MTGRIVNAEVKAVSLDWNGPRFATVAALAVRISQSCDKPRACGAVAEVVVASDVCYHQSLVAPLVNTIHTALDGMGPNSIGIIGKSPSYLQS